MRVLLVFFLAVAAVFAQPSGIATVDSGTQILFSSPQILRGSDELINPKIFRIDNNGLNLVEQRAQEGVPNFTNFFRLTSADLSGDGSVQVINAERPCNGGSACISFERWQTTISAFGQTLTAAGHARLSRNGRYYALSNIFGFPTVGAHVTFGDRVTGQQIPIGSAAYYAGNQTGRAVTADGRILILRQGVLSLWSQSGEVRISTVDVPVAAVIDDAGSTVIYETAEHKSRLVRLGGGNEVKLNSDGEARDAQISGDGNIIVFTGLSPTGTGFQLFTQFQDGTGFRQITDDPAGIVSATMAGSGWVAFAATGNGRLIGIDIRTGSNFEFLSPLPSIQLTRGGFAPGSAIRLFGQGFASNTTVAPSPLPKQLAGTQVLLDGAALPIQVVGPTEVRVQLPWELATPAPGTSRSARLVLQTPNSQFDAAMDVNIQAIDPRSEPVTPPGANEEQIAIHENNSSPVSAGNPAAPREVIHMYLSGLGPVSPPVTTGVTTPLSPLSLVTNPVSIQIGQIEAEVLQVRLQPALLGYYMADVRVPAGLAGPQIVTLREGSAFPVVLGQIYVQ